MRSNILLLITAFIWGSAFVAQVKGVDYLSPYAFNGVRSIIGGIGLIPVIYFLDKRRESSSEEEQVDISSPKGRKLLFIGGICTGIALFIGASFQQLGISAGTGSGKAGFITSLYIVIVPVLGIFLKKSVKPIIWFCVALGAVGLYLLSIKGNFTFEDGDFLVFICAFGYSMHILVVDYFSPRTDGVRMSMIQFFVCGILSLIANFIFTPEGFTLANIWACIIPLLYTGVLSSGVGYTLQIVAQKDAEPAIASLLMSLESVFALISGMIVLGETLSARESIGCLMMFTAVILSQLPSKQALSNMVKRGQK